MGRGKGVLPWRNHAYYCIIYETINKSRFTHIDRTLACAIDTKAVLKAWEGLPESTLRAARNKRQHLSHVLSRNEVDRDYAYNRALFKRVAHGWYQFNPLLELRHRTAAGKEAWQPIFVALNLPLISEVSTSYSRSAINEYLNAAHLPLCPMPVMAERQAARLEEEARREQRQQEAQQQAMLDKARIRRVHGDRLSVSSDENGEPSTAGNAPWGTRQARRDAMVELQRQIEQSRAKRQQED